MSNISSTTVLAEKGVVEDRKMFLFNGQIISTKRNDDKNEIIKFEQLNIDLANLTTTTIKKPKIQETSTLKLISCFLPEVKDQVFCKEDTKKEILPLLIRRVVLPFYIPTISLICCLLLIKSNKIYFNKISIFIYSFSILVLTELLIRYTGLSNLVKISYVLTPIVLILSLYFFLVFKFSKESKVL